MWTENDTNDFTMHFGIRKLGLFCSMRLNEVSETSCSDSWSTRLRRPRPATG